MQVKCIVVVLTALVAVTQAALLTIQNQCDESIALYDNSVTETIASGSSTSRTLSSGFSGMFRNGASAQATLAEFSVTGGYTWYDISIIPTGSSGPGNCASLEECKEVTGGTGFNNPMQIASLGCDTVTCLADGCADAYQYPSDDSKTHSCVDTASVTLTFCPDGSSSSTTTTTTPATAAPTSAAPTEPPTTAPVTLAPVTDAPPFMALASPTEIPTEVPTAAPVTKMPTQVPTEAPTTTPVTEAPPTEAPIPESSQPTTIPLTLESPKAPTQAPTEAPPPTPTDTPIPTTTQGVGLKTSTITPVPPLFSSEEGSHSTSSASSSYGGSLSGNTITFPPEGNATEQAAAPSTITKSTANVPAVAGSNGQTTTTDTASSSSTPVGTIVAVTVGVVAIIGAIAAIVVVRRKKQELDISAPKDDLEWLDGYSGMSTPVTRIPTM